MRWRILIFLTSIALSLTNSPAARGEEVKRSTQTIARQAIYNIFGHGSAGRIAACIAGRESGFYRKARGSAEERGLFQIHPNHFRKNGGFIDRPVLLWSVWYNVKVAWRLSRHGTYWYP